MTAAVVTEMAPDALPLAKPSHLCRTYLPNAHSILLI